MVRVGPQRGAVREQRRQLRRPAGLHEEAENALTDLETAAQIAGRAHLLTLAGRREAAAQLAREGLASFPDDPDLLAELSVALAESDPAGGLDAAERLLAVAPDELRGMLLASHHCDHLDRKDDAERYARKAVAFRPAAAIAHGRLAETLTGRGGRRREALAAAKQAIELDPADADYYVAAGNVELTFGRSAAAERWYEQALQLEPGNLTAINNMSRAKRVRGRLGSAVVHVDSLLQQDPTDSSARYALDEIIHTTVTHLLWLVIAANLVALWLRAAY